MGEFDGSRSHWAVCPPIDPCSRAQNAGRAHLAIPVSNSDYPCYQYRVNQGQSKSSKIVQYSRYID
ncbi:hypothetical protein PM082_021262 [Marasmius tenuissimus]|nr:hypothetical protein PM082_021262 [Marasmius tenuissimus]